jgi:hypothetical protein
MDTVEISIPLPLMVKLIRHQERLSYIDSDGIDLKELRDLLAELVAHIEGDN